MCGWQLRACTHKGRASGLLFACVEASDQNAKSSFVFYLKSRCAYDQPFCMEVSWLSQPRKRWRFFERRSGPWWWKGGHATNKAHAEHAPTQHAPIWVRWLCCVVWVCRELLKFVEEGLFLLRREGLFVTPCGAAHARRAQLRTRTLVFLQMRSLAIALVCCSHAAGAGPTCGAGHFLTHSSEPTCVACPIGKFNPCRLYPCVLLLLTPPTTCAHQVTSAACRRAC